MQATTLDEVLALRSSARKLIGALDDMHSRGETFTPRVSLACAELRRLLAPSWPKPDAGEEASDA